MRLPVLALGLLVAGCDTANGDRLGADVTFRDLDGDLVTTGTLSFDGPVEAGATVSGTYRLGDSPDGAIGASGRLEASCEVGPKARDDLRVSLDIGPDSGVELNGTCAEGLGGGAWVRFTVGGSVPAGTFDLD